MTRVKICGMTSADAVWHAAREGADAVGFIHFPASPRHVSLEAASDLGRALQTLSGPPPERVGVLVNPPRETVAAFADALSLTVIQLHGNEDPDLARWIRKTLGLKVWKVIPVSSVGDLAAAERFRDHVDGFLFDAKPPPGAALPGGNAHAFAWDIMQQFSDPRPWYLAGGLRPDNAADALKQSGAPGLDVSSGTESAPGTKSLALISDFIAAAKAAKTATK